MAIENLINRIGSDRTLLQAVVDEIQSNYFTFQNNCFFLMLGKVDKEASKIAWFKKFPDIIALRDFVFASEFERCCISIKYKNSKYVILVSGRTQTIEMEIDQLSAKEVYACKAIPHCETVRMMSWDLIEKGFGELTGLISSSSKKSDAA